MVAWESIKSYFKFFDFSNLKKIQYFELSSVIDILIIAYASYKIMMWIKETKAWTLLKGILVIVVFSLLANILRLYTVSWIISKALELVSFAAVIVFQPELRKSLEKIGKVNLLQVINFGEADDYELDALIVEEIITATKTMSKARTGALIVLEKRESLKDLIETGIPVDAVVTSQLLINIFENKTPLHDGAVIIRQRRVAAAACILPLTETEISSELGTRHRAAIGTSEAADAYVVIVSEETGDISLAKGGVLHRSLSESDLRSLLIGSSKPSGSKKKSSFWGGLKK